MFYTLVRNGEEANITVFLPGHPEPLSAHSSNPRWDTIVDAVVTSPDSYDTDEVVGLFDVSVAVAKKFEALSNDGRITVLGGNVYKDGDVVDNSLTKQIVRFLDEGVEDWQPLVNFMEKVEANPQEHSREQLYRWLERHDFTITPEGDFVGYKGVRQDRKSIHSGPGIIDGVPMTGNLPNEDGSTVEIARSLVHHDPAVGCSTGLHVGTYEYASSFGAVVLEVHVNPRDVVSVPTDCNDQKVRTCRYVVVSEIERKYDTAVTEEYADDDWDYDDYDYDEEIEEDDTCGDPDCPWCSPEEVVEDFEIEDEPEETDTNGFVIGTKVRITDEEWGDGSYYDQREGEVVSNNNGFSSLTKVEWPDGDYDYFYADEIEEVETLKQIEYHGHPVGERRKQAYTGEIFRVVLRPDDEDEFGYHENSIPLINETDNSRDSIAAGAFTEENGWTKL